MSHDTAETSMFGKISAALDRERSRAGESILPQNPNGLRNSNALGEPIATSTIAEIYLRQGLPHRALQVYRDLLSTDPENSALHRKLKDLEELLRREELEISEVLKPESAAGPFETVLDADSPPAASAVEMLSRWLEAIRRRRQHVQ